MIIGYCAFCGDSELWFEISRKPTLYQASPNPEWQEEPVRMRCGCGALTDEDEGLVEWPNQDRNGCLEAIMKQECKSCGVELHMPRTYEMRTFVVANSTLEDILYENYCDCGAAYVSDHKGKVVDIRGDCPKGRLRAIRRLA